MQKENNQTEERTFGEGIVIGATIAVLSFIVIGTIIDRVNDTHWCNDQTHEHKMMIVPKVSE